MAFRKSTIASEIAPEESTRRLPSHREHEFFIAAVTASELLHGVERASAEAIRIKRAALVERVLTHLEVLEFDLDATRHHARLWAVLVAKGAVIGPHDMQIAATALRHGFALATLNGDEFQRVPGLEPSDVRPVCH